MTKTTTSHRLRQIMSEENLRQADILSKSVPFQKELGVKMGRSALSQYVTGKSKPDNKKLYLLSKTLDVNEAWLMGYDVTRERIPDEVRVEFNQDHSINQPKGGENKISNFDGDNSTYNFGNSEKHQESMKRLNVADLKLQRSLINKIDELIAIQRETNNKLDLIMDILTGPLD